MTNIATCPGTPVRSMWRLAAAIATLLAGTALAQTQGETAGGPTLRGFGTLGVARSSHATTEFVRDLSQPDGLDRNLSGKVDTVLGIQASYPLSRHTEAVLQANSRYRHDGSYRPEVSWAFLRHDLTPDLQFRVGRLGTEFYMLSDSRLVGYANIAVRPPPDYYGPLVVSHLDGLDVSLTRPLGGALLRGKVFAGYAGERAPLGGDFYWKLNGSPILGGHLDYLRGPWQFRLGQTRLRPKHDEPLNEIFGFDIVARVPELSSKDRTIRFNSLGLVYDRGPLLVQAMLSRIAYEAVAYEDSRAGYLIAAYRYASLAPYLGLSRVSTMPGSFSTPLPPDTLALLRGFVAQTHGDQRTVYLGARWDFQANLALKAQFDFIRARPDSVFPFRGSNDPWSGRMTVFSLALDFLF